MHKKCMKSCLNLGFVHFCCMGFIRLLKKVLVDKGWRESSYNKKQLFRHCGEIPVKYLLSFFLLQPARAAAAVPLNCSGSRWFWSSGFLSLLLQHQYCCSGFFHRCWRLVGDAADPVTGLLCFLHPCAKTRWVLISLNLRKLCTFHLLSMS